MEDRGSWAGELSPDLILVTCWPRGPDQLRQVSCWVPAHHPPLPNRFSWKLPIDGPSSEQGVAVCGASLYRAAPTGKEQLSHGRRVRE